MPLVLSVNGVMEEETKVETKQLDKTLSTKWGRKYLEL